MNGLETWLVNSPPRRWLKSSYESRVLQRLGGRFAGGRALEIGCGQGAALALITGRFGAERVIGVDLDAQMVHSGALLR